VLQDIAGHLIQKKVPIFYYNQLELLTQVYKSSRQGGAIYLLDQDPVCLLLHQLDYSLDVNVFNFIINLILDVPDLRTGLFMLTQVFTGRLRSITLDKVDIPKEHLKLLLKVQTLCLLEAAKNPMEQIDEVQSEYSMISGESSGTNKQDKIQNQKRLQE
jgi:hypothetical protein